MTQTMSLANGLCKPDTAYNKLNNTEITYTLVFRFHNAVKIDRKKNHMKQNYYLPANLLGESFSTIFYWKRDGNRRWVKYI